MNKALLDPIERWIAACLREDARFIGQTEATTRVLLALPEEGALPMQTVAQGMGREASTATRFVDRAVAQGLAVRVKGSTDRRRRRVSLTPEGQRLRDLLVRRRADREAELSERLQVHTGLGDGQLAWFLAAITSAMADVEP